MAAQVGASSADAGVRGRRSSVDVAVDVHRLLVHRAVRQHDDEQRHAGLEAHELHAAHPGRVGLGPMTSAAWRLTRGQQLARLGEQVLERLVRGGEEVGDRPPLPGREVCSRVKWSTK